MTLRPISVGVRYFFVVVTNFAFLSPSMIPARVASVPIPLHSFRLAARVLSLTYLWISFIAWRSVASVKRFGGVVVFSLISPFP